MSLRRGLCEDEGELDDLQTTLDASIGAIELRDVIRLEEENELRHEGDCGAVEVSCGDGITTSPFLNRSDLEFVICLWL